ncbi:MAG: glycyl-radical enzyme activating protein [Clostridia bacterium]|nr:glycyl-radical enzyme activating protein [Clostridia bacterium]
MPVTAVITNIARASLHDGPGIRTVVYFKGCGLRCAWCHNPETLTGKAEILYAPVKCIACGRCIELCPACHSPSDTKMVFDRRAGTRCGKCADLCPTGALSKCGEEMTLEEVLAQLRKDAHYYAQGGGVTLSGGECLLQSEFAAALLERLRAEGIHTAIESALFVPREALDRVIPHTDLFFADCKLPDPIRHRQYTGAENHRIMENLDYLTQAAPGRVICRIPLIPGVNDAPEDMDAFAALLSPMAERLQAIELLRYNPLGESKYTMSGRDYVGFGESQSDHVMLARVARLESALSGRVRVFTVL